MSFSEALKNYPPGEPFPKEIHPWGQVVSIAPLPPLENTLIPGFRAILQERQTEEKFNLDFTTQTSVKVDGKDQVLNQDDLTLILFLLCNPGFVFARREIVKSAFTGRVVWFDDSQWNRMVKKAKSILIDEDPEKPIIGRRGFGGNIKYGSLFVSIGNEKKDGIAPTAVPVSEEDKSAAGNSWKSTISSLLVSGIPLSEAVKGLKGRNVVDVFYMALQERGDYAYLDDIISASGLPARIVHVILGILVKEKKVKTDAKTRNHRYRVVKKPT